jgi:two-component system sensor histidine kinase CpxA
MRSLFSRILLWSFGTLILSFFAFVAISLSLSARVLEEHDLLGGLSRMQAHGALTAYRQGGAPQLQGYLSLLEQYLQLEAEYHLADAQGRDVLTGADLTPLLAEGRPSQRLLAPLRSRLVIGVPLQDRRFQFILVTRPPVLFTDFLPYYLLTVLVVGALSYLLAARLVKPLKSLSRTVEGFGRGDLALRFQSRRKDEIGALGRAFDDMAGRIEFLLKSERQLLQDISHELRSPLARLSFAAELVRAPETREQGLEQVRLELDRLAGLIGSLLQVARGESDASQLSLREISLEGLLREVAGRCSIEAAARQCRISISGGDTVVIGDRELLDRALENVLRNAIRHSPDGSGVEAGVRSDGEAAEISIRDYGEGVPPDSLERIFRPFYRLEQPAHGGGVGLGLSIAQRAIALHRGTIQAFNESPGLRITIRIPLPSA